MIRAGIPLKVACHRVSPRPAALRSFAWWSRALPGGGERCLVGVSGETGRGRCVCGRVML